MMGHSCSWLGQGLEGRKHAIALPEKGGQRVADEEIAGSRGGTRTLSLASRQRPSVVPKMSQDTGMGSGHHGALG